MPTFPIHRDTEGRGFPLAHWIYKDNFPHTHSSVTAPSLRTIFHPYHSIHNSKPDCLKQLENRLTPIPPQIENNRRFCQASTEYTAFHCIKTITHKPAKNYIKLPPCITPSPFPSTLLPNSFPTARAGWHQRDTAPEERKQHWTPHTALAIPFHVQRFSDISNVIRGLHQTQPASKVSEFHTTIRGVPCDLLWVVFSLTFDGKVAPNNWIKQQQTNLKPTPTEKLMTTKQILFLARMAKAFKHDPKAEGAGGTGFKELRSREQRARAAVLVRHCPRELLKTVK